MIKFDLKNHRREVVGAIIVLFLLIGGISVFKYTSFNSGFEIVDDLGGNIFPSAILSVATTDAQVITPSDSMYLGNPKSCIEPLIAVCVSRWRRRLSSPVPCRSSF